MPTSEYTAPAKNVLWFWSFDIIQATSTTAVAIDNGTGNMLPDDYKLCTITSLQCVPLVLNPAGHVLKQAPFSNE